MLVVAVVVCVKEPEVPWNTIDAVPAAAVEAAVKVTVAGSPAVTVKVAGEAVTPVGSPLTDIAMEPLKLFWAEAATVTVWPDPPALRLTAEGVADSAKSPLELAVGIDDDPLQEASSRKTSVEALGRKMRRACMWGNLCRLGWVPGRRRLLPPLGDVER
jgi:hypothetical protein